MSRFFRCIAVLLTTVFFAGCLEMEQKTTLYPDGSGKLVLTISVKGTKKEGKVEKPDAPKKEDLENFAKNCDGVVAWAVPKIDEGEDSITITLVAYFDDINAVKMYSGEGEDKKLATSFVYEKRGEGGVLQIHDAMTADIAKQAKGEEPKEGQTDEEKKMAEEMAKLAKSMMKGFKISVIAQVPGKVDSTERFMKKEGRTASLAIDEELLYAATDGKPEAKKAIEDVNGDHVVTWSKSDLTQDELAAWAKEKAEAKATWEKLKSEAK